jgi:hypothetical protein
LANPVIARASTMSISAAPSTTTVLRRS